MEPWGLSRLIISPLPQHYCDAHDRQYSTRLFKLVHTCSRCREVTFNLEGAEHKNCPTKTLLVEEVTEREHREQEFYVAVANCEDCKRMKAAERSSATAVIS